MTVAISSTASSYEKDTDTTMDTTLNANDIKPDRLSYHGHETLNYFERQPNWVNYFKDVINDCPRPNQTKTYEIVVPFPSW